MITLATVCLNNYDGLNDLFNSAEKGTVVPDRYYIFDNGRRLIKEDMSSKITVITPSEQVSLAFAWNYLITNIPEERIIANDDIILYEDTIEKMVNTPGGFIYAKGVSKLNMYSLYLIRDSMVNKVGYFDTDFYPAYYEDNDYHYRMHLAGENVTGADCDAIHNHGGSNTLKNYTPQELEQHHVNFRRNTDLYTKKWGGLPGSEVYKVKYNANL
jgi:hypothetical protein